MKVKRLSKQTYDAIQFNGENAKECIEFLGNSFRNHFSVGCEQIHFVNFNGKNTVNVNDYILRYKNECHVKTQACLDKSYLILDDGEDHF